MLWVSEAPHALVTFWSPPNVNVTVHAVSALARSVLRISTRPKVSDRRSAGAAEAAFGVDDLAGDPGGFVGGQPGDQAGGVVGRSPSSPREVAADDLVAFWGGVAGVDRAGVDGVDGDGAV